MLKWLGIELEGFGSEGAVVNLLINLLVIGMILYFFKIRPALMAKQGKDRRKAIPSNPNDKPGKAEECLKHMKKLTKLETKIDNFTGWLEKIETNNRDDHHKINEKIDKIRNNRR